MRHLVLVTLTPGEGKHGQDQLYIDSGRLLSKGLRAFKCKSKRELVHLALTELLKNANRKEILKPRGEMKWEVDLEELRRSLP